MSTTRRKLNMGSPNSVPPLILNPKLGVSSSLQSSTVWTKLSPCAGPGCWRRCCCECSWSLLLLLLLEVIGRLEKWKGCCSGCGCCCEVNLPWEELGLAKVLWCPPAPLVLITLHHDRHDVSSSSRLEVSRTGGWSWRGRGAKLECFGGWGTPSWRATYGLALKEKVWERDIHFAWMAVYLFALLRTRAPRLPTQPTHHHTLLYNPENCSTLLDNWIWTSDR